MNQNLQSPKPPTKSIFRRYWWIAIIILIIVAGIIFIIERESPGAIFKVNGGWPDPNAKYITAVPVDLTQIQKITKYRSCAGHVRAGYNFDRELEYDSSMKHYFYPIPEFQGTIDKVALYAPFDGTVYEIFWEADKGYYGRKNPGNGINLATSADPNVKFGFGHLYFVGDIKVGDHVKAGQLIGYAALGEVGNDFDLDLTAKQKRTDKNSKEDIEVLGSVFDHMTPEVLAEFAKYGITPDNTKFSKEFREANPCGYAGENAGPSSQQDEAWVELSGD